VLPEKNKEQDMAQERREGGRDRERSRDREEKDSEFVDKLVHINRVAKVVKGGRVSVSLLSSLSVTRRAALVSAMARRVKCRKLSARRLKPPSAN
jgi:hypothetical protein